VDVAVGALHSYRQDDGICLLFTAAACELWLPMISTRQLNSTEIPNTMTRSRQQTVQNHSLYGKSLLLLVASVAA